MVLIFIKFYWNKAIPFVYILSMAVKVSTSYRDYTTYESKMFTVGLITTG